MKSETKGQLALLLNGLERDFYHPLNRIAFSGFPAEHSISLGEAETHEKDFMPAGTHWGDAWSYCWLFAELILPPEARGERIVLQLNPGGESTLFVDGKAFGTRRAEWVKMPHHLLVDQTLTACAQGGEHFVLALETYGGTPLPYAPLSRCATGPVFPEDGVRMESPPAGVLGESSLGLWNEEAYQLWLDLRMLYDIHESEPDTSFWREKIDAVLCGVLNTLDMEQPLAQRRASYRAARESLRPLMGAHNGTFAPTMSAIANSHLDVAWLWPLEETARKTARTFAQQLRLLKEYPEARYLQSQAILYELCRTHYPELFERIRQAVREGQWVVEGAMWVEPDTNLAGGEALIRQILYGKRYFKQQFGVDCKVAWLPDSFGYSAALPQILSKCGIEGLTTQKIFWTYNDAEAFPYHAFCWQGMDGTGIDCYLHMQYESFVDAKTLNERWAARIAKDGTGEFLLPFGYGDGGGGPTRDDYEQIRREADLQGVPKMRYETPADFFARRKGMMLPAYRGELYFQCHRGTYTTQAAIKRGNRLCEQAIRTLEIWAARAAQSTAYRYPAETIERLWKNILLNQFHDILPGSAIARVYQEARVLYARTLSEIRAETDTALCALKRGETGVTVLHSLSAPVQCVVRLDERFAGGAETLSGTSVPITPIANGALALVSLPAMGGLTLVPSSAKPELQAARVEETEHGFLLHNGLLRAEIDRDGLLYALVDETTGQSCIGAPSNRFCFYRDMPRAYDAWDIDSQTEERGITPEETVSMSVSLAGGVRAAVKIVRRVLSSVIEQTISLDAGQRRLDFDTTVDWHERHKLLKVAFDTGVYADEAANQIQFGFVRRPAHRSRPYDADRFEVCNHGYTALYDAMHGAAVLNNGKYGVSMLNSTIALTLLRGATCPDEAADQGMHHFSYAYYCWNGSFSQSCVAQEAALLNSPPMIAQGEILSESFFTVEDPAVILETIKQAEDGDELILRLYESMSGRRETYLNSYYPIRAAWQCNMLEEPETQLEIMDNRIALSVRPFEILTVRLSIKR